MTCGLAMRTRPASRARPGRPRSAGSWPRRPTRRSGTPTRGAGKSCGRRWRATSAAPAGCAPPPRACRSAPARGTPWASRSGPLPPAARTLAVEDPSSPRMREIAAGGGVEVGPLACDARGARAGELPALGADAVVVTPAHQYPLGVTLSPGRRGELLAWASSTGGIIIEDDYDGELRYDRQPVGALQALDPGRVIYVGTTSKSLAAALRVGWLVAPPQLTGPVAETIRVINAWPSSLEQLALARFIEAGMFDRHIRRMRGIYRKRRDLLAATLAGHAPMLRVTGIAAGGHALVRLPPGGPGEHELIAKAALDGLALAGLSSYRVSDVLTEQRDYQPALVICYGTPAARSYRAAVAALRDL